MDWYSAIAATYNAIQPEDGFKWPSYGGFVLAAAGGGGCDDDGG